MDLAYLFKLTPSMLLPGPCPGIEHLDVFVNCQQLVFFESVKIHTPGRFSYGVGNSLEVGTFRE